MHMAPHFDTLHAMSVSYLFPPNDADLSPPSRPLDKPKRDTKTIGDQSELEVAVALARAGYIVSKPLGDSHLYDLVIDDGVTLSRVQVKTGRLAHGSIRVSCCSTHANRGGTTRSYRGEIEFIGVFCPQTGDVYMVPESEIVDSYMHLRVAPTVNRQDRHIRWASRYKLA
jgi:hypothetical protein